MTSRRSSLMAAALLAGLALGGGVPAPAAAATSIEVVVNDQPITSYDVAQRVALMRLSHQPGDLRSAAIDELINEKLQAAEAKRVGIHVNEKMVDKAFDDIAKRVKLSPAQLSQALRQNGIDPATLRQRIRVQVAWAQLVRAKFKATAPVTEQDLVAELNQQDKSKVVETTRYTLQQITVVVPDKPSAADLDIARNTASQLRSRFTSCDSGLDLVRGAKDVIVKPIGKRTSADVPDSMRSGLQDTAVGHLTPPDKTDHGLVMLAVCGKDTVNSSNAAMKAIEGNVLEQRGMLFAKQYMNELHRNALIERR